MKSTGQSGDGNRIKSQFPIRVVNGAGSVIAPYSLLHLSGASDIDELEVFTAIQPAGADSARIVINGPAAIAVGGYGAATNRSPVIALYEVSDGTPSAGEEWGPLGGSWTLRLAGSGYVIIGGVDNGRVQVMRKDTATDRLVAAGPDDTVPATLYEKIEDAGTYDDEVHQIVYAEVVPDGGGATDNDTVRLFTERVAGAGSGVYRAIRGLVKGAVTADDTTFVIDNVIPLASGADPVAGNAATEITVQNIQREGFADNTPVTAIYDGAAWELLLVERYRIIRGMAVGAVSSGDGDFTIDNIEVIGSGLDPRTDPTSSAETVAVKNFHSQSYADNEWVEAIYNDEIATGIDWEGMKKPTTGNNRWARAYGGAISAATGNLTADWGSGNVKFLDDATGALDASATAVDNLWNSAFVEDSMVLIDTAYSPPRVLNGTCEAFSTWE